ncbi:MAG TPA: hypothetical protein VIG42_00320 [Solirubrobacteraceae bacterium]
MTLLIGNGPSDAPAHTSRMGEAVVKIGGSSRLCARVGAACVTAALVTLTLPLAAAPAGAAAAKFRSHRSVLDPLGLARAKVTATATTPTATNATPASGAQPGTVAPGGTPTTATPTTNVPTSALPSTSVPPTAAPQGATPPSTTTPSTVSPGRSTTVVGVSRQASPNKRLSTGALALAILGALLALGCAVWVAGRWMALEPRWTISMMHSLREASYHASATWAEFSDWARIGH